jgi:cytochrome c biogenesis protein CcmG, thiol:disulfide interchange protein DsbE
VGDEKGSESQPRLSPAMLRAIRLLAFVLVPAAFVGFLAYSFLSTAPPKSLVGKPGPDFSLALLGTSKTLSSDELKGHPVVLNFWASWCVPCREEAPALQSAWEMYANRGVRIVGVNLQDSEQDAKDFVKEFGLTYPIVRDPNLSLWTKLGVTGLPETFFLDRNWIFVGVGSGQEVGQSGTTKILGAIQPDLLERQIGMMLKPADRK